MKLPAELLKQQFPVKLVRGVIVRFEFDAFADPKRKAPGPKFAVVLNRPDVSDPIHLALSTSKTEAYEKTAQFKTVVVTFEAGEYARWPLRTAIAFRQDPIGVQRSKLEQQFLDGRLTFVGTLTSVHIERINAIVANSPSIRPNLKPFLLP